jgi:hypothetical protein
MDMTAYDPVEALQSAGFPLHCLSEGQRDALATLTEGEVAVLVDLSRRLTQTEPEVQAHSAEVIGGLFF